MISILAWSLWALPLIGEWADPVLELPAVFGDGMVLQRERPVAVWGHARSGSEVAVELAGARARAVADRVARVHCAAIPRPTAVRYGWGQDPDGNLFDAAGFSAAPFVLELGIGPDAAEESAEPAPDAPSLITARR